MEIIISQGSSTGSFSGVMNTVAISNGASTVSVTYTSPFANTNYALVVMVRNTTDSSPIFLQPVITAKSTTGFTATFNAPTDSANYSLDYIAGVYQ